MHRPFGSGLALYDHDCSYLHNIFVSTPNVGHCLDTAKAV